MYKIPVRRNVLEKIIEETINNNTITVIKSSSGQGKTTLALQVAFNLREEYTIYSLSWCRDSRELGNILKYFNSRLKLGEKILIFLDNLNSDLSEWNKLAQVFHEKLKLNYKILLTTREEDWYLYSGDQTNLYSLKIVNIYMDINQAEDIYNKFKEKGRIHKDITSWQSAWEKVADRKLLIEYVFLLTHGEMIEDRIKNQIKVLNQSTDGNIKLELLRLIALSNIIGIKLRGDKLISHLSTKMTSKQDINEIISSIENEYFLKIDNDNVYIEGLHPVRSQHLINVMHQHQSISDTLKKLIEIIDEFYIGQLFSQIPFYMKEDKEDFYKWLVNKIQDKSYGNIVKAIEGIFSGYIFEYFKRNKEIFDDANRHGGLDLFLNEINPWNTEVKKLSELLKIMKDNQNIQYLVNLSDSIPKLKVEESDIYIFCYYLTEAIRNIPLKRDINDYGILASWLRRIDNDFNILNKLDIEDVWSKRNHFNLEKLSRLFYEYYISEIDVYTKFINSYKDQIISFLKIKTDSVCIFEEDKSIYIKYILLPNEIKNGNKESIDRINKICRFLPTYSKYCTDAIKPKIEVLENIIKFVPDNSHKAMPIRNIKLSFDVDLTILWKNSILSHYEFPSIYDWQKYWMDIRIQVLEFVKNNIKVLESILKEKKVKEDISKEIDDRRITILNCLLEQKFFPYENRPFDKSSELSIVASKIRYDYFTSISNYLRQFINILINNNENNIRNIAILNLKDAKNKLLEMQDRYNRVCESSMRFFDTSQLEEEEYVWINELINLNDYYIENIGKNVDYSRFNLKEWIKENKLEFLRLISDSIFEINKNCTFKLIAPKRMIEDRNLTTIVIGVEDFDINNYEQYASLFSSLMPFADISFDFLTLIFIKKVMVHPQGLRIHKNVLTKLKNRMKESEESIFSGENPLPIEVTQEHLNVLGQESLKLYKIESRTNYDDISFFTLLFWKYSQYKKNLDKSKAQEKDYFDDIREKIMKELEWLEDKVKNEIDEESYHKLLEIKSDIFNSDILFTDDDLNFWINKLSIA